MAKFYYYIDYGSGYVLLDPQNNQAKLALVREINPFIQRKNLSGSFMLIGTEAQAAFTYFITGGNYEAPIRIYENGILGVGVLQYEGWTKVKSKYDFRRDQVTFESFRTNDAYTALLATYTTEFIAETYGATNSTTRFNIQGQSANCNQIQAYSWSGTAWTTTGNALSIPNQGRLSVEPNGSAIAVYDSVSKELRRYVYSAPNWSLSVNGTSYFFPYLTGNGALASYSANQIAFIDDYFNEFYFLQYTTGTWTVALQRIVENISFPSLAYMSNSTNLALVDNGTKVLRTYSTSGVQVGETLSLGDIHKPQICALDGANDRIALVDSKTFTLRCYEWNAPIWSEIGSNIKLPIGYEINITQTATNEVNVVDAEGGFLEKYTFSGTTTWAKTGNTTAINNGYMAAVGSDSTVLAVIQSDTYSFASSPTAEYRGTVNKIIDIGLGLYPLEIPSSGHGSTIDIDKLYMGDLSDISELSLYDDPINFYKYSAADLLKMLEIFQQYWYIDGTDIKFTQPVSFSGTGTDITVPSNISIQLNQRDYNDDYEITKEKVTFANERGAEFDGEPIDYGRNTLIEKATAYNITTDFNYVIDNFMGLDSNLKKSGLFLIFGGNDVNGQFICESGTGIITSVDIKNNYLSKSKIQDTFWKDYRYADTGTIDINGSSSAVQNTVRPMIFYANFPFGEYDVSLTQFPASIGSLDWGSSDLSYITRLELELDTLIYTAISVKLDL